MRLAKGGGRRELLELEGGDDDIDCNLAVEKSTCICFDFSYACPCEIFILDWKLLLYFLSFGFSGWLDNKYNCFTNPVCSLSLQKPKKKSNLA